MYACIAYNIFIPHIAYIAFSMHACAAYIAFIAYAAYTRAAPLPELLVNILTRIPNNTNRPNIVVDNIN